MQSLLITISIFFLLILSSLSLFSLNLIRHLQAGLFSWKIFIILVIVWKLSLLIDIDVLVIILSIIVFLIMLMKVDLYKVLVWYIFTWSIFANPSLFLGLLLTSYPWVEEELRDW